MSADTKGLMDAHEDMAAVLDAKFPNLREWKAFRTIDRMLIAALANAEPTPALANAEPTPRMPAHRERVRLNDHQAPIPYMTLADRVLTATGAPITTTELMSYIVAHRAITADPKKARIVVQSSLSKDKRFRSIPWEGGRAWWYADKPIPKKEAAGS